MTLKRLSRYVVTLAAVLASASVRAQSNSPIDSAVQKFWAANSPDEAGRLTDEILKTGVTFEETMRRLKLGRTYNAQKTGVIQLQNRTSDGVEHHYAVNI